ncbi:MAG: cbb3-type cytochrome oxidase maturation protein [Gallionellaceae bacterium]|nr:MAG: cbb3-type cytochrome oxidase maturation protein [Gallionellaceae bacterium]
MEVIYSLIPGMTFFGLLFVAILVWAVRKGQYEDMEGNASRILLDDDEDAMLASQPEKKTQKEETPPEPGDKPPAKNSF